MYHIHGILKKLPALLLALAIGIGAISVSSTPAEAAIVGDNIQIVTGFVERDGRQVSGEGFKSQRIRVGLYAVEYDRPFSSRPTPVVSITGSEWATFQMSAAILEINEDYLIVGTSTPERPEDCAFTFNVTGEI